MYNFLPCTLDLLAEATVCYQDAHNSLGQNIDFHIFAAWLYSASSLPFHACMASKAERDPAQKTQVISNSYDTDYVCSYFPDSGK